MKRMVIVGLGLIGGSTALAINGFEDFELVGVDYNEDTLAFAREQGICHQVTADGAVVATADVTVLCLPPQAIVEFLSTYGQSFRPESLVVDMCGVKGAIVAAAQNLPANVDFIGCHPMAGTEHNGIRWAFATLFQDAHFLMTPQESSGAEHIALVERMAQYMGFRDVIVTTAERHDAIIAYTSQMMHIIALAVCDDADLFACKGFEGNSFRDCTRVAALDVPLWHQLFSLNSPALVDALRKLETNLATYRQVLEEGQWDKLTEKLTYSAQRKHKMNLE